MHYFIIVFFMFSAPILALDKVPSSAFPGRIEDRLKKPITPKSKPKAEVELVKPIDLGAKADNIRLVLNSIVVEGVSIYSNEEMGKIYQGSLNKEISMTEVMALASKISNKYRDDGYILAQAIIPANQELDPKGASLKIVVYEGYINKIVYEDVSLENKENQNLINRYLNKILDSCPAGIELPKDTICPLHVDALERYLLLAKDLSGVDIETVLIPGDVVGSSNLFVKIKQRHISAYTSVDNRGSKFVGPTQFWSGFRVDSPFGAFSSTNIDFLISEEDEVKLVKLSESIPLFSEGLQFRASGIYSTSDLGGRLKPLEIEADNVSFTLGLYYPIIRTRADNLSINGGFTYRDQDTDILNQKFTRDSIRVLDLGMTYDHADGFFGGGVSLIDFRVSQGIDVLDATHEGDEFASVSNGESTFTKLNLHLSRLQRITDNIYLSMGALGQYAFDSLLVSEQFGFGGKEFGRAYDPSEILGDHGISGSVELQYTPNINLPYPRDLQYFAYYDIGKVWLKDAVCGCVKVEESASASSVGTGFRFNITDWLSSTVEVAFPLTRKVGTENNKDPRFFFGVSARY